MSLGEKAVLIITADYVCFCRSPLYRHEIYDDVYL
jgi:hypothetical protein